MPGSYLHSFVSFVFGPRPRCIRKDWRLDGKIAEAVKSAKAAEKELLETSRDLVKRLQNGHAEK